MSNGFTNGAGGSLSPSSSTRQTLTSSRSGMPQALSSLGLPAQDSYFMQHFLSMCGEYANDDQGFPRMLIPAYRESRARRAGN